MNPSDQVAVRIGWVTAPDLETARSLGRTLVEERLVACVNVLSNVDSIYRWEGAVEEAREVLLMLKTRVERTEALAQRVVELHPYDVPEVIWVDVDGGNPSYLSWVLEESEP